MTNRKQPDPGFSLTINDPPPRKNDRHEIVVPKYRKPGQPVAWRKNSKAFEFFALCVRNKWRQAGSPRVSVGEWHIDCVSYFARVRHLDIDLPFGDVDASVSCVLDALQLCGAIDDDVRFVSACLSKHVDAEHPRIEIRIRPAQQPPEQLALERIVKADVTHPGPLKEMAREGLRRGE